MAGGKGTRFWPLSRESKPKQLLSIAGEKTMIQETVERLEPIIPPERIIVITGAALAGETRRQLPQLSHDSIVVEPVGRNTAPCVALAASIIHHRDPSATMALFPSDHVFEQPDKLLDTIKTITDHLERYPDKLATIGIEPSYPETGYGYIRRAGAIEEKIFKVERFCEKPDKEKATEYVDSGNYYWNSGMFFWKTETILHELRDKAPELMSGISKLIDTPGSEEWSQSLYEIYPDLPSISIDYAVMEKAGSEGNVVVAQCDPGWNDVGSWRSLYDLSPTDEHGSHHQGELVTIDSKGVFSYSNKRLVAVVGVNDVMVIETEDAILVLNKERDQDVRKVTEELKKRGLDSFL